MLALQRLIELELRASNDDSVAMLDVVLQHFLQRHHFRHQLSRMRIRDEREHDDAERRLHHRVLIELIENDTRNCIALQLDDDAHTVLVRLVAKRADSLELPFLHQLRHVRYELGFVDLVRQLGDDDLRFVGALFLFDHRAGAHHDSSAAGLLIILDSGAAVDVAASREVWAFHQLSDLARRHLRIVDQSDNCGDDFTEIVRRNVGCHPDRDAGRPIDDEIRNRGRQNLRLLEAIIEVRREIDGVLVDVGEHLHRNPRQPRFGVPVRGGRIAVNRAEVSLAVDERIAKREVLHHAHERVVHRRIAMRVVFAEDVTDHRR